MTKLSEHGEELFCYLCTKAQGLISVRSDGTKLRRTPYCDDWTLYARKKDGVSLQDWTANRLDFKATLPPWRLVSSLPSPSELEAWTFDGVAETVTGDTIEPDGIGLDGAPSWLLALGVV